MARIAILTVGVTSHLNTAFELARRLEARGHDIIFRSRPKTHERIASQGFRHAAAPQVPEGPRLQRLVEQRDLQRFIDEFKPHLVVADSEMHVEILWLLAHGIEPMLRDVHLSLRRQPGVPPLSSNFIPTGRAYDRLATSLSWQALRLRRWLQQTRARIWRRGQDPFSLWRKIAVAHGLDLSAIARRTEWPLLYYPGLEYLHLAAAELDFPGGATDTDGPLVYKDRRESDSDESRKLRDWLAKREARPLIVCTMGSILNPLHFYRRLIAAAEDQPYDLLVAARDLRVALPPNVYIAEYVPVIEVLQLARVVVSHGGASTMNECLSFGVPMLVCSGDVMDENGNAARVHYHGVGLRKDIRATPRSLRNDLRRLLEEASFRQRAAAFGKLYTAYDERDRAVARIEARLV